MANIVLQLSTLTFPLIGLLVQEVDGLFSVSGRPRLNLLSKNEDDMEPLVTTKMGEERERALVQWVATV